MADDVFEYVWDGPDGVWLGAQDVDGVTPTPKPGDRLVFADPQHVPELVPFNDAAKGEADLFEQATGSPVADLLGKPANEVVALLGELGPDALIDVQAAEQAGKARKTVLARLDELLTPDVPAGEDVEV